MATCFDKTNFFTELTKMNNNLFFILGELIFLITLYAAMIGGSVYGNFLVLLIVRTTKSLQNINNLLVANLAIADIILSTVCTPFKFHAALMQRWDLPEFLCKLCPFVENVCVNLQILNLCLIAKDRYEKIFFVKALKLI